MNQFIEWAKKNPKKTWAYRLLVKAKKTTEDRLEKAKNRLDKALQGDIEPRVNEFIPKIWEDALWGSVKIGRAGLGIAFDEEVWEQRRKEQKEQERQSNIEFEIKWNTEQIGETQKYLEELGEMLNDFKLPSSYTTDWRKQITPDFDGWETPELAIRYKYRDYYTYRELFSFIKARLDTLSVGDCYIDEITDILSMMEWFLKHDYIFEDVGVNGYSIRNVGEFTSSVTIMTVRGNFTRIGYYETAFCYALLTALDALWGYAINHCAAFGYESRQFDE